MSVHSTWQSSYTLDQKNSLSDGLSSAIISFYWFCLVESSGLSSDFLFKSKLMFFSCNLYIYIFCYFFVCFKKYFEGTEFQAD